MFKQALVAQTETWTHLKSSEVFLNLNVSGCFNLSDLIQIYLKKKVFFKKLLLRPQTSLPDLIEACGQTYIYVCLCHGNPSVQQRWTCAFHPSLTFVISVIIFHPQIYVQHNQCSFVYHDSESPSVSSPTLSIHAPFVYVHESHMSACELFVILHPWPQTWGEGNSQVSPGLWMSVVPVMWEENVVYWQPGCSIFIVPLNKHMGLDELVSILLRALSEHIAGGPITVHLITRVSIHTSGCPSSGTDDTHAYVTCSASS